MQTIIRLKIEKFIEGGQEYFVATSDDLQGLVAEGRTAKEAIEIAEDVAKVLLDWDVFSASKGDNSNCFEL